jgi:hypothetical protein
MVRERRYLSHEDKLMMANLYKSGLSSTYIANLYKTCDTHVLYTIKRLGVVIRKHNIHSTKRCSNLSAYDISVLNGELLGDGCLTIQKNGNTPHFQHTSIHKEYSEYLCRNLSFLQDSTVQVIPAKSYIRKDDRIRNHKESYHICSKSDLCLRYFRDIWYPDGKKIVPKNLFISRSTLLHWWLGDGSIHKRFTKAGCSHITAKFSTQGFSDEEIDFLSYNLLKRFGIKTSRQNCKSLYIWKESHTTFFNAIGKPPFESLAYRWI